jgi:hypothetical protein
MRRLLDWLDELIYHLLRPVSRVRMLEERLEALEAEVGEWRRILADSGGSLPEQARPELRLIVSRLDACEKRLTGYEEAWMIIHGDAEAKRGRPAPRHLTLLDGARRLDPSARARSPPDT